MHQARCSAEEAGLSGRDWNPTRNLWLEIMHESLFHNYLDLALKTLGAGATLFDKAEAFATWAGCEPIIQTIA